MHIQSPKEMGRRSACLLLAGILWLLIAYSVWHMPDPIGRPPAPHELAPGVVRAVFWASTGLAGVVGAFVPKPEDDVDGADRYAFFGLMFMPAERAFSWAMVLALHYYDWAGQLVVLAVNGPFVCTVLT